MAIKIIIFVLIFAASAGFLNTDLIALTTIAHSQIPASIPGKAIANAAPIACHPLNPSTQAFCKIRIITTSP
jgi:hypothetical protein